MKIKVVKFFEVENFSKNELTLLITFELVIEWESLGYETTFKSFVKVL
jgi:hypothetical protein